MKKKKKSKRTKKFENKKAIQSIKHACKYYSYRHRSRRAQWTQALHIHKIYLLYAHHKIGGKSHFTSFFNENYALLYILTVYFPHLLQSTIEHHWLKVKEQIITCNLILNTDFRDTNILLFNWTKMIINFPNNSSVLSYS